MDEIVAGEDEIVDEIVMGADEIVMGVGEIGGG